jgi:hypothetical protein
MMVECLAVEMPAAIQPGKYQTLTTRRVSSHDVERLDSKSRQVSPGRI